jgi:hypothetical protein
MTKEQTAVEWLISQLQKSKDWYRVLNEISQSNSAKIDIVQIALQMEEKQLTNKK